MVETTPHHEDYPLCALRLGARLGEFEVRGVLGVGGFGIVYRALDHNLEREVAVKEYMPATLAGRTSTQHVSLLSSSHADTFALGLRSFVNEAKLLAKFDHPSLVKVHRFWEANGTAYMAMPLYHGRTAKQVRQAMGHAPDEAWLRSIVMPLLGALECLHAADVFHRDIAPDNILIEPDGRPVLLDFGAARRVINDRSQMLTAILKPAYAPIEQYGETGNGMRQGPWTDIYALGATLHFLLVGRPPAPAPARTVADDARTLSSQSFPGVSLAFLALIDWMLAPRPDERPQSIAEVRKVLEGDGTVPIRPKPALSDDDDPDRTLPMPMDMIPGPGAVTGGGPTERLPTRYPETLPLTRPLPPLERAAARPTPAPAAAAPPAVARAVAAPPPFVEPRAPTRRPPAAPVPVQPPAAQPPSRQSAQPLRPPHEPANLNRQAAPSTVNSAGRSPALWGLVAGVLVLVGLGAAGWWWTRAPSVAPPSAAGDGAPVEAKAAPPAAPQLAPPSTPPAATPAGAVQAPAAAASVVVATPAAPAVPLALPSGQSPAAGASHVPPTAAAPVPAPTTAPAAKPVPARPPGDLAKSEPRPTRPPAAATRPPAGGGAPSPRDPAPTGPVPAQAAPPAPVEPSRPATPPVPEPAKPAPAHPLAKCDSRSGVLRFVCLDLECAKMANSRLPECVKLREEQEAARQPR